MVLNPLAFLLKYLPLLKFGGGLLQNRQNSDYNNRNTAGGQMEQKILTGKKYGIHPLEAIGGNSGSTVIPMQNPLAGIQAPQEVDPIDAKTKRLVLDQLEMESRRSQSLLIGPLSLYEGSDDKKYWGINSHFFGYSTAATTIVYAANAEEALFKMKDSLPRDTYEKIKKSLTKGTPSNWKSDKPSDIGARR